MLQGPYLKLGLGLIRKWLAQIKTNIFNLRTSIPRKWSSPRVKTCLAVRAPGSVQHALFCALYRLPCSRRCSLILDCGHQCPSLCVEDCPTSFCQICCSDGRKDQRVDMLEFKSHSEINLDETPIVVLSCGHPFTAETLDGHMQMSEVYEHLPATGEYTGLHENIESLAPTPPRCPDRK